MVFSIVPTAGQNGQMLSAWWLTTLIEAGLLSTTLVRLCKSDHYWWRYGRKCVRRPSQIRPGAAPGGRAKGPWPTHLDQGALDFYHESELWGSTMPLCIFSFQFFLYLNLPSPIAYIARLVLHVWRMVTENNVWRMHHFEIVCLTPDFEMLCLAGIWRASDTMFWNIVSSWRLAAIGRNVLKSHVRYNISKSGIRPNISKSSARRHFLILKRCVWLASGGLQTQCFEITRQPQRFKIRRQTQHFQNLPPDAIFCDHASDVYHEWHSVIFTLI